MSPPVRAHELLFVFVASNWPHNTRWGGKCSVKVSYSVKSQKIRRNAQFYEFASTNQLHLNQYNHILKSWDDAKDDAKIFRPPAEICDVKNSICVTSYQKRAPTGPTFYTIFVTLTNLNLGRSKGGNATNTNSSSCALTMVLR